ncbi:hypothetical protein OYC64_012081 [Pagothenia borchgrevinki]|uniref:HAT C-terminal dimerisation domain-containing protein n=1 Tax=Pagothenia borchgrevinki TaxID=8213 RepID=A0ABD2G757_PAGBO
MERVDDGVAGMINEVKENATRNGLKMPDENEYRVSKTPARYRQTRETESLQQATYDVRWRTEFYEAVDLVHSELSRRFDQDWMRVAAFREKIAIDAANVKPVAVLDAEALKLPTGFDLGRLQLQMLGDVFKETVHKTVQEVASRLSELHPQTRSLFGEAEKLVKLCMCLPISVASSERSFSTLRRLKTWLRSSMSQTRLTHLTLMHVHGDIVEQMDIQDMMKSFISMNPERKNTFGVLA